MYFVGIAGGSGSGKTTFTKKILHRLKQAIPQGANPSEKHDIAIIHQDSYYLPEVPKHLKTSAEGNFDHPDAFDWKLLRKHLSELKQGGGIHSPVYDYGSGKRAQKTEKIGPARTIIFEGIYSLWDEEIRNLFDLKIFLHVEADIRFIRRLHRDAKERSRSLDSIIRQYYDSVRPMHQRYLEPTRQYANLVVGEETDIAADVVAAKIIELLQEG